MSLSLYSHRKQHDPGSLPEFLERRMDEFYLRRWKEDWRGRHIMRGRAPGKASVCLFSNDYLSIADHPAIRDAQIEALRAEGQGTLMSAIFLHGDNPQRRLEDALASYTGFPASILCQSGYAANVGLIQALAGEGVPVYIDMIAHASLHEGIHSAGATPRPFRHNDVQHLERQMREYGPGVVCVDSVYSTNGSVCPLRELVLKAREYGCLVVVDESHTLGISGPRGGGMVLEQGLCDSVDFLTASLAKAFAGRAGLVCCPRDFVDYFSFTSQPAIFSSCLLPHELAGLCATLEVIRSESWRREWLLDNAARLRTGLSRLGYGVAPGSSWIIGLEAGEEHRTQRLREALEERDIFASVFCAPATGRKRSLLRLSVHAGLSGEDVSRVLQACEEIRDDVDLWRWPSVRRRVAVDQVA